MKWWEFLLMFVIIIILLIPTIIRFTKNKGSKGSCSCGCEACNKDCPMH